MKVLLTGSEGQLGFSIIKNRPIGTNLISLNKKDFDLSDKENIRSSLNQIKPDFIINCGAYTNVDNAEDEKKLAMDINAESIKEISKFIKEKGGKLIQISTDFIFNGLKNTPYKISKSWFT